MEQFMTQKLKQVFEELLNAPLCLLEWQIISRNPELYSDEGIEWLKKERERAWEKKDYKRIERLSSKILLFERCREVGAETAFFGKMLGEEQIKEISKEIPKWVVESIKEAEKLQEQGKWEEVIGRYEKILIDLKKIRYRLLITKIQIKFSNELWNCPIGKHVENLEKANKLLTKSLIGVPRKDFPKDWASCHHTIAAVLLCRFHGNRAEDLEKAIKFLNKSLEIFTNEDFPEDWARNINDLATAYLFRIQGSKAENLEKAIALFKNSLTVLTYENFPKDWARRQANLACAYCLRIQGSRVENLEKAIEFCTKALEFLTQEDFPIDWAGIQVNLASAYYFRLRGDRAENLEKVIELNNNALKVRTLSSFPIGWAKVQNNLACVYKDRILGDRHENIEKAIELFKKSLQVFTCDDFPENWALSHNNLANVYMDRIFGNRSKNIEKAIKYHKKAQKVWTRKNFSENWAMNQSNLAYVYYHRLQGDKIENQEKSIELLEKILEVRTREDFPEDWATTQSNLASVFKDRMLGDRKLNLEKTIELFKKALNIQTPETFPNKCRETSIDLTDAQLNLKLWHDALTSAQLARQADRILQRQATSLSGKTHVIEEGATLYYLASLACAHLDDVIGAVEWLEQGKTRELGDALEKDRAIMQGERYVKVLEKLKVLDAEQRGAVPGARPFIEVAEDARRVHAELEELIKSIQIYKPDFLKETTISREEIRSILTDETEAYIVFNVTSCGSAIMLLTRLEDQPIAETFFFDDFNVDKLNALVKMWSENLAELKSGGALSTAGHKHFREQINLIGRKLYDAFLSSVYTWLQEHGKNIKKLIFIPHLSLHILPLHLIKYDTDNKPRYLIEDYDISYAPSISVILKQQSIKHEIGTAASISKDALIVSNPTGDLQFAQEEAQRIGKYFTQKKNVLEGRHATADNLINKASGCRFLHLSCHGEFDPVEPWNSGIILASEENQEIDLSMGSEQVETVCMRDSKGKVVQEVRSYKEHGEERINFDAKGNVLSKVRSLPDGKSYLQGKGRLFTLKEVFTNIDLTKTEMVVLSACETGLVGIKGKSDEFVGLAGGFIRAGAKNVVASLWVVDDQATTELMEKFYSYLFEQNLEPSKALGQAQLDIKQEQHWKNPFYWGAFRVLGS